MTKKSKSSLPTNSSPAEAGGRQSPLSAPESPSRSINNVAMTGILSFVSLATLNVINQLRPFPGTELWPFPGLPLMIFLTLYLIGLTAVVTRRSWGYPLGTIGVLVLFVLFSGPLMGSLTRPGSDPLFTTSIIVMAGAILSIPFGIQGLRETRGRISMTSFRAPKLTSLALVSFGIVFGGIMIAYLASTSSSATVIDLEGPPDVTLLIEEENTDLLTKEITVKMGDNVLLLIQNLDPGLHDFNIDELDVHVDNPPGGTSIAAFTADREGTFHFYCSIPGHREAGMEGIIRVQG